VGGVCAARASKQEIDVSTVVQNIYLDSEIGVPTDLIAAGTSLENPYVYDSVARELKSMANQGLVRITAESLASNAQEPLIERIRFERVR
jgi:hypothetical protein